MHELSMVMNLANTAERTAEQNDMKKVELIHVGVGEMSGAVDEYIDKYFNQIKDKYSYINNATLVLSKDFAKGKCKNCGEEFLLTENEGVCPKCGERDFTITIGKSITVHKIEGE
ncbi:MAG: hydrogenase maturation nickel metallochaperone HypA [Lachnospiraceae bacterium]|nr:hydrogenase maturation nickel metallochaperone HypA [Lachnospiraceae bacterium]